MQPDVLKLKYASIEFIVQILGDRIPKVIPMQQVSIQQ